ncbi:MAG: phosphoribosyl-ATP diphosphatase [Alphaproteobacteria bacterium]
MTERPGAEVLERLYATIASRRGADRASSYTARLFADGPEKIAQKVGEEAVETVLASVGADSRGCGRLVSESADLLYHLLVLWAACGAEPAQVWAELARREGTSGVAEKAARATMAEGGDDGE